MYYWPIIQGICPEKFTFISPVIFEICLNMPLFHSIACHRSGNKSAQNLYWVCIPGPFLCSTSPKNFHTYLHRFQRHTKVFSFCITNQALFQPRSSNRLMPRNIYDKIWLYCPRLDGCPAEKIKVVFSIRITLTDRGLLHCQTCVLRPVSLIFHSVRR